MATKKIRVYELARELGVDNAVIVDLSNELKIGVKSHSSSIDEPSADRVRRLADSKGLRREVVPEPEPEPEPVPQTVVALERSPEDTLPLPVTPLSAAESHDINLIALFDDPLYKDVIHTAVRERAERLLEEVVNQVVAELEPLLQRHLGRNVQGAQ